MFQHRNNRLGRDDHGRLPAEHRGRGGFSLAELLISIVITSLIGLALAVLSTAVRTSRDYADRQGLAAQNARVVLERIANTVDQATASVAFPGIAVFTTQANGYSFPDILVVWHPTGVAVNPSGQPLYCELVIYSFDPATPTNLIEVTVPTDTRTTPLLSDTSTWLTNLNTILNSTTANKVVLTNLLRVASTATASAIGGTGQLRGALRFRVIIRPSVSDFANYQSGKTTWSSLNWVQDISGSQMGLRQSWCSTELQLMPGTDLAATDPKGTQAVPFFGSAALYYMLHK